MTAAEQGPLRPSRTRKFKRNLARCKKRGYDMDLARLVMGRPIHRECHLKPDWLLIYRIHGNQITFVRTGTYSDRFDE